MDVGVQISSKKESELKDIMNKTFDPDDLEIFRKIINLEDKLLAQGIMILPKGKKKDSKRKAEI